MTNDAGSVSDVMIVTVSYHSIDVLRQLLDSIESDGSWPVTVTDNASEPDVAELVHGRGHRYIASENRGYGAAINLAGRSLPDETEWILVVNPDVELHAGAIRRLLETARADSRIGAIGPRVLDTDGSPYPSARSVPSLRVGIGHATLGRVWPGNPWSRRYLNPGTDTATLPQPVGWLSGSCMLVRRSAFEQIGGFDDGYFMYFEDVDLGVRLAKRGFLNVFEPRATVVHSGAHSTSGNAGRMIAEHHRSAARFIAQRYPGPVLAPLRGVLRVGLATRSAVDRFVRRRADRSH